MNPDWPGRNNEKNLQPTDFLRATVAPPASILCLRQWLILLQQLFLFVRQSSLYLFCILGRRKLLRHDASIGQNFTNILVIFYVLLRDMKFTFQVVPANVEIGDLDG